MHHSRIAVTFLLPVCLGFRAGDVRDTEVISINGLVTRDADCEQLFGRPNLVTQWSIPSMHTLKSKVFDKLLDSDATREDIIADYSRKNSYYDYEKVHFTESAVTFRFQVELWSHHKFQSVDCDVNAAVRFSSSPDCVDDTGSLEQGRPHFGHALMNLDENGTTWMLTSKAALPLYEIDPIDPRNKLVRTWHCTNNAEPPYVRFEIFFESEEDAAANITTVREVRTGKRGGKAGEAAVYVEQVFSGRMRDATSTPEGMTLLRANEVTLTENETREFRKYRLAVDASDRLVVEYVNAWGEWKVQFKGYPALKVPPKDMGVFICTRMHANDKWKAIEALSVVQKPLRVPSDLEKKQAPSKTTFPRSQWKLTKVDGWVDYVGQFQWVKMARKLANPYDHGQTAADTTTSTTILVAASKLKSFARPQRLWATCALLVPMSVITFNMS